MGPFWLGKGSLKTARSRKNEQHLYNYRVAAGKMQSQTGILRIKTGRRFLSTERND
jgi:hypothetical protein